jgi:excisionase family DNA binding protein
MRAAPEIIALKGELGGWYSTIHPRRLLLTVPEVASALGVGRNVVYELVLTRQLASIKIGRLRRVPVALKAFVNAKLTFVEGRRE